MPEKIIAYDLDDVIFPFIEGIINSLEVRFNCNLSNCNFDCYNIDSWLIRDHPELYKLYEKEGGLLAHFNFMDKQGLFSNVPPYIDASESMQRIKNSGRKIAIITHRATPEKPDYSFKDTIIKTTKWLNDFKVPFDYLEFSHDKAETLKKLEKESNGRVILFAEDYPANVLNIIKKGYNVALVNHPHNQRQLPKEMYNGGFRDYNGFTHEEWIRALDSGKIQRISHLS